jgi:hypothetical protein
VPGVGALTAVLSFLVDGIGSEPAERHLPQLNQAKVAGDLTETDAQTVAELDRRASS